ncbi:MAG: monoamine oxidase [Thermoleophilaceae bacterium]|nr:monoamine oxidase [Thermoleophilaceae bacterium]
MDDNDDTRGQARLTRRGFAGGAAAGALGTVLGGGDSEARSRRGTPRSPTPKRADVVVVGAGPAGLAAATRIAAAGRAVVVLEARHRVGGRVKNWRCGMPPACDCGQLVAPAHSRVRALASELGVNLYPQHAVATGQGNDTTYINGRRNETPAGGPLGSRALGPLLADGGVPFSELDSMAATLSPESPWESDRAAEWDAMSVDEWKRQNTVSDNGRFFVDLLVFVAGSDAGGMSLLHLLAYLSRLGDGKHGTDEVLDFLLSGDLAEGGLQQIPDRLAKRLGRRVVLGAPVRRIAQRGRRVRVESDAVTVLAKRVIVATAPSLNALIDFEPGLPGCGRSCFSATRRDR